MSFLDRILGRQSDAQIIDRLIAEAYLRDECDGEHISALVRQYAGCEAAALIERQTGVRLTDAQAERVVQRLRDECGMAQLASLKETTT